MSERPDGPLVAAQHLAGGYAGVQVCPPVTFTLQPGEVLAVVGANGTGKSTLLRTALGALTPLGGQVTVLGERPDPRDAGFRAAVAAELGDDAFFPALTVAEHLLLTAYGHGLTDAAEVVDALLVEFALDRHRNVLPQALSSGQRRRLLLASVLARPRALLVLDEPEQRLDAGMRARLGERLLAEGRSGTGVLLACHDPDLVLACASACLVLTADDVRLTDAAGGAATIRAL